MLFALISEYDTGFEGFTDVFIANSKEDVITHMLEKMKEYIRWKLGNPKAITPPEYEKGCSYYYDITSADWGRDSPYQYRMENKERKKAEYDFILKASVRDIERIIKNSYVDGDSSSKISLVEIIPTVELRDYSK